MGEVVLLAVLINVLTSVTVGMLTPQPEVKPVQVEILNEYECKTSENNLK